MKKILLFSVALFSLGACVAKSEITNPELLPKDIASKPKTDYSPQAMDEANLAKLRAEIDYLISKEKCSDASLWTAVPLGSKSCGGPLTYIAYPKKLEKEILPKIKNYNTAQNNYIKKYGIISDCVMVVSPKEITCENGKPVLVKN